MTVTSADVIIDGVLKYRYVCRCTKPGCKEQHIFFADNILTVGAVNARLRRPGWRRVKRGGGAASLLCPACVEELKELDQKGKRSKHDR